IPASARPLASTSALNCGLVRERGTVRTSTTRRTSESRSRSTNVDSGRVECPIVKNGFSVLSVRGERQAANADPRRRVPKAGIKMEIDHIHFLLLSAVRSLGPAMPAFSPHQDTALKAVATWLKAKPGRRATPQIFRLFGYAGTGKTTLAKHVAQAVDGKVLYAAFTGKAAQVMRNKGCTGASTIHSLIYKALESE